MKKIIGLIIKTAALIIAAVIIWAVAVNFTVIGFSYGKIVEAEEAGSGYDCILVLGCSVRGNRPGVMLKDRLDRAIGLYFSGVSDILFMSGDGISDYYDEVSVMINYAVEKGVPEKDIAFDEEGLSTYESIYRVRNVFKMNKVLIVTSDYHLYRAVFLAKSFDLDAVGVKAMPNEYDSQLYDSAREFFARNKDFIFALFKPDSVSDTFFDKIGMT